MNIENRTKLSTLLIKRLMKAAGVKREPGKTLIIKKDKRYKYERGLFIAYHEQPYYVIKIRDEGDTTVLAHEVRHLAQLQRRAWWDKAGHEGRELDAEMFEHWFNTDGREKIC